MTVRGLDRGERAALIVNECQRGMTDPELAGPGGLAALVLERRMIERIEALAADCRVAGVMVVHSTIVPRTDYAGFASNCLLLGSLRKKGAVVAGGPAAAIHAGLTVDPADVVIERVHGLTPFHDTQLDSMLRNEGVETVIVTGVSTNVGIPGICLDVVNRGYQAAVVPEDCTAGAWPEAHEFQVTHTLPLLATVTTSEDVRKVLLDRGR